VAEGEPAVIVDVRAGICRIRLNRPHARNALNMEVKAQLADAIALARTSEDVRAILITGSGGIFCAGGDIVEMELNDSPVRSRARLQQLLETVMIPLAEAEKPTVAAVEGHAHGAGLSLALACDLIVVSQAAQMSCAFSKLGLVPDCGALYFLPRRLSMGLAKELIFTGRRFSGAEALSMGLANRAVSAGQAEAVAAELAAELARGATVTLGLAKRLLESATSMTLRELAKLEVFGQAIAYSTEDHARARVAFSEKRPPSFNGR
jgi:2-(1,2-epoxy-1,2-dihydrophenyl)acetyl-CoA isomerase